MTPERFAMAARCFSSRGQLAPGGVFVGRRTELSQLSATCNPANVQSFWVSGPRQIGKSSLVARVPFETETGGRRIDLSLADEPWQGLDGLAAQIFDALCVKPTTPNFAALFHYVQKSHSPLLVVLDEFDLVAVDLRQQDQAGLRKMTDKIPHFGWVFITRTAPLQLCQDYGDVSSRLVSICNQIRLGFLSPVEVDRMVQEAAVRCDVSLGHDFADWIYQRVGGYPVVNQALLKHILLDAAETGQSPSTSQLNRPEFESKLYQHVADDLIKLWADLHPSVKRYVAVGDPKVMADDETRTEMNALNLIQRSEPRIPGWLRRARPPSNQNIHGGTAGLIGSIDRLMNAFWFCDYHSMECVGKPFFLPHDRHAFYFQLARPLNSAAESRHFITQLHRMVVLASQRSQNTLSDEPMLIREFHNTNGWRMLCELRELLDSDKAATGTQAFDLSRLSLGFLRSLDCETQLIHPEQFQRFQRNLLEKVADSVAGLADRMQQYANGAANPPRSGSPWFAWVHVSDIHFGHGDAHTKLDQSYVARELVNDLLAQFQHGVPKPGAIFVTGDIGFSGGGQDSSGSTSSEYASATHWLTSLAAAANLKLEQVFLVPGNHDVDRNADKDRDTGRLIKSLRSAEKKIASELDNALSHVGDRAKLASRQANYLKFVEMCAPACRALYWHHVISCGPLDLILVGLNTALLAADDEDQGHLALGLTQIPELPSVSLGRQRLIMLLSHHPLQDGWLEDQRSASAMFAKHGGIQLSGHVHTPDTETKKSGGGSEFLRIVAGAVHGDPGDPQAVTSHGYSIGAIYPGSFAGEILVKVWPRRWSDREKAFRVCSDGVPDRQDHALHRLRLPV